MLQAVARREEEAAPVRARGADLTAKLSAVRRQLLAARGTRERAHSLSSLELREETKQGPPPPYTDLTP